MRTVVFAIFAAAIYAGCARMAREPDAEIQAAVQATLQALRTQNPGPTPEPLPTSTQMPLAGIFCEYEFCIGHPRGMAFYDVVAKENPNSPAVSTYEAGRLATYGLTTFIEVEWQMSPGASGPEELLGLALDDRVDQRSGQAEVISVASTSAAYVPLRTMATELLPFGGAAAWECGERGFAWKAYSNQADFPRQLAIGALEDFQCRD